MTKKRLSPLVPSRRRSWTRQPTTTQTTTTTYPASPKLKRTKLPPCPRGFLRRSFVSRRNFCDCTAVCADRKRDLRRLAISTAHHSPPEEDLGPSWVTAD